MKKKKILGPLLGIVLTNQIKPSYIDCSGLVLSSFSTAAATHTHTQTHTHADTHTHTLADAQHSPVSLSVAHGEQVGEERSALRFSGLLVRPSRARILWITVRWSLQRATKHPHGSWICIPSRFPPEIDETLWGNLLWTICHRRFRYPTRNPMSGARQRSTVFSQGPRLIASRTLVK